MRVERTFAWEDKFKRLLLREVSDSTRRRASRHAAIPYAPCRTRLRLYPRSLPSPLHQDRLCVVAMAPLFLWEELEVEHPAVGGLEDLARIRLKDNALAGAEGL